LAASNWDQLCKELNKDIKASLDPAELQPKLQLDAELDLAEINLTLVDALKTLEPHGQGNPEPLFLVKNVNLDQIRRVGAEGNHLQGRVVDLKAIGFRLGHLHNHCDQSLDLVCRLGVDNWQGMLAPQLFIVDMRAAIA
jgi:single-stranded-DNA-specific exonuclease